MTVQNPTFHSALAEVVDRPAQWISPYVATLQTIVNTSSSQSIAARLNAARTEATPVQFVDPSELPRGEAYEAFIARTSCVPTRDNFHDLFNGLMWLSYPRTKRRLNELQAREIAARGVSATRGSLRDALTVFDENSALIQAPAELVYALRARDWRALFIEHRTAWKRANVRIFGHALLEKLMTPRKPITAHVWFVDEISDAVVASTLGPERLAAKDFCPLPILGIPGWWDENEDLRFYDDADVFRPRR